MRSWFCVVMFCAVLSLIVSPASARTWTDKSGKRKIEAELVGVTGDTVELRKADGKTVKMALGKLSQADQDFLKENGSGADGAKASKSNGKSNGKSSGSGLQLETIGISLGKKLPPEPGKEEDQFGSFDMSLPRAGTQLVFLVANSDGSLIGLDEDQSKVTSCADDTGNSLLEKPNPKAQRGPSA